ncbi:MAG TPA: metallophosphoesterase [Armatimonadota bacterium]|nr:metallophosphoesterase [Armatimonadota bacterium]
MSQISIWYPDKGMKALSLKRKSVVLYGILMLWTLPCFTLAADVKTSASTVPVNGKIDVTISGGQSPSTTTDWIGLYEENVTPSGTPPSIWWANLLDVGITDGNGTMTFDPSTIPSAQQSRYTAGTAYKFIVANDGGYTVSASASFTVTATQTPLITSFNQVNVTTQAGTAPTLPDSVTDNTGAQHRVTWDTIAPSRYAQAGSFTVQGQCAGTGVVAKASVTVNEGSGPALRFAVLSDIHIRSSSLTDAHSLHFQQALSDIHNMNAVTPLNALCIVGDFTDNGSEANYNNFNTILNSISHPQTWFAIGNHETGSYTDYSQALNAFLTNTGMPAVYHEQVINGYHFIFLGTESGTTINFNLTTTQLDWLENSLAAADLTNKPAFVFIHEPVTNTVAGSAEMQDLAQSSQLQTVLSRHPNSILFSGHTHCIVTSPNQFYNATSHYVNTGSVAYLWYGPTWTGCGGSQGLYVDVYADKVVVKTREFERSEWITPGPGGGQETIEMPVVTNNQTIQRDAPDYTIRCISNAHASAAFAITLQQPATITLTLFDITGKQIAVPISNRSLSAGVHAIPLNMYDLSAGSYYAAVRIGAGVQVSKIVVLP